MNRWGIPAWLEMEVKARDRTCIYCGIRMTFKISRRGSRKTAATWEHIINDATIVTPDNIALCCAACNSSKGTKDLADWMRSDYCRAHGITEEGVADIVKKALKATTS